MTEAARNALGLRYQLLPYLYTAFRRTAGHGCPLARPLFLAWPGDRNAHEAYYQWLMGDSVLVTPVLEEVRHKIGNLLREQHGILDFAFLFSNANLYLEYDSHLKWVMCLYLYLPIISLIERQLVPA